MMFEKLFTGLAASAFALGVCGVGMVGCEEDNSVEDTMEDVGDGAEEAGEDLKDGAEEVGENIEDGVDDLND